MAAYSTRTHPAASVSTPLAWNEWSDTIRADHFRVDNLWQRLRVLKKDRARASSHFANVFVTITARLVAIDGAT